MTLVGGVSVEQIERVLARITEDKLGVHATGPLVDYPSDLVQWAQEQPDRRIGLAVARCLRRAGDDIDNVGTLLDRIEWTRAECVSGKLEEGIWTRYAALDIEHIHVEVRSAMDYVAQAVTAAANKPGQAPDTFRALLEWIKRKPENRDRLGHELADLIEGAPWFGAARGIRDATVHDGAKANVYWGAAEGVLFQVHRDGFFNLIAEPTIAVNENQVLDFHLYAAAILAHVLEYLERVCVTLMTRLPAPHRGGPVRHYSSTYWYFREWSRKLIDAIQKRATESRS